MARKNKPLYAELEKKVVFQAGEDFSVADVPVFISCANYAHAIGRDSVRIPIPYMVSLTRCLYRLDTDFGIARVFCTLVRASGELMRPEGAIDAIQYDYPRFPELLSNEWKKVFSEVRFHVTSFKIPSLLMSTSLVVVEFKQMPTKTDILRSLQDRTLILPTWPDLLTTDGVFEYVRRTIRRTGDLYETALWAESIMLDPELSLVQVIDSHCVHIPDTIDAIRALSSKTDYQDAYKQTNIALGIDV